VECTHQNRRFSGPKQEGTLSAAKFSISYHPADPGPPLWEITVGDMMEKIATAWPDRTALVEGVSDPSKRRRWTFRQLVDQSKSLARALLRRFEVGDRIGLLAPETPEWMLFQHALSYAGLIIVPVNPTYTERELEFVLRNSGARGLIFAEASRNRPLRPVVEAIYPKLPELRETISLDEIGNLLAQSDPSVALPQLDPRATMQIQYTSGTTGQPKGACLHHMGVVNTARQIADRADFPEGGVWINAMPMFHIGGGIVSQIGTFSHAGTFVLMQAFEPGLFLELIESEQCNNSLIVPTMILALLNHPDMKRRDVSSFKSILSGASNVPAALVVRAKEEFNCNFCIMYGQTESNGPFLETSTSDPVERQTETIGRPTPHIEVMIANIETSKPQPLNTVGEIWVRGFLTMSGYYGMPEASAAALTSEGWLRTGDLGRMDEDGYFKITGRLKEMIIRGGMNLYPKEIEDVIFQHPKVGQIAVVGLPDETWGEIVAAVVQPKASESLTADELYAYCRKYLSPQKTPERWFFVDRYPMTATGKIQKNKLTTSIQDGEILAVDWRKPSVSAARAISL
jgi:acyl-CoA synthetase (AMP-forming)/AMP-acid ligase II